MGTLLRHAKGVLSYYNTGLTSGKNGRHQSKKSVACSPALSASSSSKLRLYALHEAKFKFIG
jgi:hypothetical protein